MAAPSDFPDYYRLLGISPQADAESIRRAYRALARKYHPDAAPDNPFAPSQFRALKEAYEVLSNRQKRTRYDAECRLRGVRMGSIRTVDAPALLQDATQLLRQLETIGKSGVHPQALIRLLLFLLQDRHLAVFKEEGRLKVNDAFAEILFKAATYLPERLLPAVIERMKMLQPVSLTVLQQLETAYTRHLRRKKQARLLPWMAILLTLLLCLMMAIVFR